MIISVIIILIFVSTTHIDLYYMNDVHDDICDTELFGRIYENASLQISILKLNIRRISLQISIFIPISNDCISSRGLLLMTMKTFMMMIMTIMMTMMMMRVMLSQSVAPNLQVLCVF